MDRSQDQRNTETTENVHTNIETPFSASRSSPRAIDSSGFSRDPIHEPTNSNHENQARNVLHQLSARRPLEGVTVNSHSEAGVFIASPERHMRRRLSNTLSTGIGGFNAAESGRSWTRAGLLQPYSYRGGSSQQAHTAAVESGYLSPSASASGNSSALSPRLSPTPSPAPQSSTGFFSRTPDDIRASTVELSMLAVPLPRAQSDYLGAAGPSSFPPHRAWSPPTSIVEENENLPPSAPAGTFLVPHQMRTPLTAADLARLAYAHSASISRVAAQRTHVRDREPTFASLPDQLPSTIFIRPPMTLVHASFILLERGVLEQILTDVFSMLQTQTEWTSVPRVSSSFLASGASSSDSEAPTPRASSAEPDRNAQSEFSGTGPSPSAPVPSTPSGLSLLLAQQRSPPATPCSETQKQFGISQTQDSVPEGAPQSESLRQAETTSRRRMSTEEETPLLPSHSPTESSRGPSLYYGTRSRSVSPERRPWWSWTQRKPSAKPTEVCPTAFGNGHGLLADPGSGIFGKKKHGKPKWIRTAIASSVRRVLSKETAADVGKTALRSIPAVLLGMLLNVLDGVSYGMIMFPSNDVFQNFGGIGVSMFFVTTIVSQLVYSFGGSSFAGANGSMMIEVVPFFHILASEITRELGEDNVTQIVSTTMVAFVLSSVLTGLTFFLLGHLRLGVIIGFFPRHILVGCIGGVGVFLIQTGLAVCARIDDDEFSYSFETLKFFFGSGHVLALWMPALGLAILLRLITHRFNHQLIFPVYFIMIPAIFYTIVAAARLDIPTLRRTGWIFDTAGSSEAWYKFYSYYSWKNTSFRALWVTMPTQFALLFFNILHPPLNVPALAVSLDEDVDTNKELVAHGYSNLLAGVLGTVPNYLVYVNTLLFYRVGGTTRVSGFILALATFVLLVVGTGPIGYIPIMLVGALIFVLGIDLVKEALWDTRHRVNRSEYLTIISIMVCMTLWDFVVGVLFGIVVCCFFFVVQNSRRRSVRAMFTGESAMSAVRRPSSHRDYIRQVAKQTVVLRLQGFLFFGTIAQVEEAIRALVEPPAWQRNPIRFLVIDLTLVGGVDMSSAEAFVRIQRLLYLRDVTMVLCGFSENSPIGNALRSVGLLEEEGVELFSRFGDAMEWTENAYLRAWFMCQKSVADTACRPIALPGRQRSPAFNMTESFQNSPRRSEIHAIAGRTLENEDRYPELEDSSPDRTETENAYLALSKAFSSYGQVDFEQFRPLLSRFERITVTEGSVLWEQGDPPDGLYLIESGVLRAMYTFPDRKDTFEESMVGGTLAGELSALSNLSRNARVVVEKDAVLWKLSTEKLEELQKQHPKLAGVFIHLVLKVAKTDYDILLSALASRQ
ncbi:hypothetical protein ACEPAF_1881 [Sanghuangporus sanghuang]